MALYDPAAVRVVPLERQNAKHGPRAAGGLFAPIDAHERFRAKCRFEPRTGCVLWTGGTTRGRGNTATYGSFWYEGRRWFAHRWAAAFIHGLDVDGLQVGHCCPNMPDGKPNTLCVEHVTGQTQAENLAELNDRLARARCEQSADVRQQWLFVEIGLLEPEPLHDPATLADEMPWYDPPEWLGLPPTERPEFDDCPF